MHQIEWWPQAKLCLVWHYCSSSMYASYGKIASTAWHVRAACCLTFTSRHSCILDRITECPFPKNDNNKITRALNAASQYVGRVASWQSAQHYTFIRTFPSTLTHRCEIVSHCQAATPQHEHATYVLYNVKQCGRRDEAIHPSVVDEAIISKTRYWWPNDVPVRFRTDCSRNFSVMAAVCCAMQCGRSLLLCRRRRRRTSSMSHQYI